MKNTKQAISLIVLVLTIVIMVILTGVIVISLNNSGILDRARNAVDNTNVDQVQEWANVAWGEAYLEANDTQKLDANYLKSSVEAKLIARGVTAEELSKYNIEVSTGGVSVELKSTTTPTTTPSN